ncbi:hypothetical protein GCM10010289_77230 [Streptomyces violascens]|uniref:Uncharacterized protein n=1 Tax=Streptomyces violascens TaxID=67381 RepID=A0ABQ3R117_9ACTN|nr:hypothetical protein GCM10010289_77230 [Streptomyces violascens]GHI43222.1 hypothetical protein Sviol_76300 [Streptomyces violascens]
MTQTQAPSTYVTPECREARNLRWETGHLHCPGPLELRQPPGTLPLEVLNCACPCHRGKPGAAFRGC